MSPTATYSEREVVLRERAAYVKALFWLRPINMVSPIFGDSESYESLAAKAFPLPKVTRPRVEDDKEALGVTWSVRNGHLCFMTDAGVWHRMGSRDESHIYGTSFDFTRARVALWNDLLDHPTEECDE